MGAIEQESRENLRGRKRVTGYEFLTGVPKETSTAILSVHENS